MEPQRLPRSGNPPAAGLRPCLDHLCEHAFFRRHESCAGACRILLEFLGVNSVVSYGSLWLRAPSSAWSAMFRIPTASTCPVLAKPPAQMDRIATFVLNSGSCRLFNNPYRNSAAMGIGQFLCFADHALGHCDVPKRFGTCFGSCRRLPSYLCSAGRWSSRPLWKQRFWAVQCADRFGTGFGSCRRL